MASPSDSTFGALLRRHRLTSGLTQAELAERAGLSVVGLDDLESGVRRILPHEAVLHLADALALSPKDRSRFEAAARLADALDLAHRDRAAFEAAGRRATSAHPAVPAPSSATTAPAAPDVPSARSPSPTAPAAQSAPSASDLGVTPPTGTVTFLFTDMEGSTRLLQRLGSRYATALADHHRLLRAAFSAHGGYEVDTQGESFFIAFPSAPAALAAATAATRALAAHQWPDGTSVRVRIGLHTGAPQRVGASYVGLDVHRAARIAAAGHGGQILVSDATTGLVRGALPDGTGLRDLGAHRLKDLQQAEHITQLVIFGLPSDFPPLKALDARSHNLPVQPSPLVGREPEIATLAALLRQDTVRLVTITGPGGVGKTRLGLRVAAEVLHTYPDGVWHVRLSRLTDSELVLPTIAATLNIKESGGAPLDEVLRASLRDKRLLLMLDNFEQVASAALAVAHLLEDCPGLAVLVTSRVALHLRGEHEFALAPLALPDPRHLPSPERLSLYAAVALFVERARAAQADFTVTNATAAAVAAICARLDGLPLAIELAAARVKLLPPPALLGRLDHSLPVLTGGARDVPEHQQTMRATLAWSEDLLRPAERRLFRRLAVFAGGGTIEAVEAICAAPSGAEPLELDVLDGLAALVDQSLIQQREEGTEPRFGMLHVVREFAAERLEASGEADAIRRAHAEHFVALAERAEPELVGPAAVEWLGHLERELDNLRAALGRALNQHWHDLATRLGSALGSFWNTRGDYSEGRRWLEDLLALRVPTEGQTVAIGLAVRAKLLTHAAGLAWLQQDLARAEEWATEELALAERIEDPGRAAAALLDLGLVAQDRGDSEGALTYLERCLEHARRAGDLQLLSWVLNDLGMVRLVQGDGAGAQVYAEEAIALTRRLNAYSTQTVSQALLAGARVLQGDLAAAHALAADAVRLSREVGYRLGLAYALLVLAVLAALEGRGDHAARLLGAEQALLAQAGGRPAAGLQTAVNDLIAPARAALGEAAWADAFAAGRALTLDEVTAAALGESAAPGESAADAGAME